ncbi:hypothetical protein [Hymenobacter pini]|uniref:hypothetical protein n=1 Tax=Hymenobacter pini TaxID=2880879 RepID=UPI001CF48673|nr:hypothetical protein [Hymenobacter pini]MCA8830604.1 hypothetical protein [Hymenobacter pini]
MAELKALIWVIIGLAVFIWQMIQKARATTAREQQQRPRNTRTAPPLPSGSFDELLKQMQAQNQPRPLQPAPPEPRPATTPAGRAVPRETAPPVRNLEVPSIEARSLEQPAAPRSLEAPRREARRAATLPRAAAQPNPDDYWTRPASASDNQLSIREMLRNPASVRSAFVLGEILQRRF